MDATTAHTKCVVCKEHVEQTDTFSSVGTRNIYAINSHLACASSWLLRVTTALFAMVYSDGEGGMN